MRVRPVGAALMIACLSACTDVLPPIVQTTPPQPTSSPFMSRERSFDSATKAILAEARRNSPISYEDLIVIGVLGRSRTDTSAFVVFDNTRVTEIWEFRLSVKSWKRTHRVERGSLAAGSSPIDLFLSPSDWGGPVGQLFDASNNVIGVLWSPAPWEGYYAAFWNGPGNARRGKCNAGTQPGSDGPTKLWCQVWVVHRNIYPYGSFSCGLADCRWAFRNATDPNDTTLYGATDVEQDFIIETPVHLSISGPAQPIRNTGTYTWTVNPSGGDGSTYAYTWDYSQDQATWTRVGNAKSYSRTLASNDPDFYLRASAASLSGNWRSVVQFVNLVQPLQPPLYVSVSGPTAIDEYTYATWMGAVSGGVSPYTYQWTVDGALAGGGTSVTTGNWVGGTSHTIALTVTDAVGQNRSASVDVYVTYSGGCLQPPCP
jgi:hypothetical protein